MAGTSTCILLYSSLSTNVVSSANSENVETTLKAKKLVYEKKDAASMDISERDKLFEISKVFKIELYYMYLYIF